MSSLLLVNGRLHTQDPAFPRATALAIRDGRILAVGNDDEMKALAGPGARTIDLRGRRVLPGLTDAHFHYYDWALGRRRVMLAGVPSLGQMVERLAQAARKALPGAWILGQGWNETEWPERRLPSRADLDPAAQDHPVLFWRSDLHLAVANSAALRAAGIDQNTPDPPMGKLDRDAAGRPTGILRDLAINLVTSRMPEPPEAEVVGAFQDGFPVLHKMGLTGIQDQRLMGGLDGPPAFRAWQALEADRAIGVRVWMNIPGEFMGEAIALGLRTGMGGEWLRVGHCKYFSDGAQGVHTAWMLDPYSDEGGTGLQLTPIEAIEADLRRGHDAGLAIAVHAIGDRAVRELSLAFQRVLGDPKPGAAAPRAPHRIEHLQLAQAEDLERVARLGVMASVQPISVPDDIPMMAPTIGPRTRYAHAWKSMLEAGVKIAFGSDAPVSDPNPFLGIHAAVTRCRLDGSPEGGWHPEQRLTVAEAVWAYSMGPALVTARQGDLGSLSPGKLADLVVPDLDIFQAEPAAIKDAKPVLTVFAGEVVHENA
jgi:predicted amidohydrolase YtcJ